MSEISGLGHVGLYCNDLKRMRDFYSGVRGRTISDEDPGRGICVLSAAPESEHHELALVQAKETAQKTQNVQQVGDHIDLDQPADTLMKFAQSFEEIKGPPRGAQS